MKKLKRFSIFILVGILLFSLLLPACGKDNQNGSKNMELQQKTAPFFTLEEAYECGLLTVADLEQIAALRSSGAQSTDVLSEELSNEIKEARAKEIREDPDTMTPDITAEEVAIRRFYGMYNTYPVVIVRNSLLVEADIYFGRPIEIAGVTFTFGRSSGIEDLVLYKPLS